MHTLEHREIDMQVYATPSWDWSTCTRLPIVRL